MVARVGDEGVDLLCVEEEIDKLLKSGVTPAELVAAQKGFLQSLRVSRTDDGRLAGMLADTLFAKRTFAFEAELEKRVSATTTESVLKATRKYFNPKKMVIVTAGDFNKKPAGNKSDQKKKKKASK